MTNEWPLDDSAVLKLGTMRLVDTWRHTHQSENKLLAIYRTNGLAPSKSNNQPSLQQYHTYHETTTNKNFNTNQQHILDNAGSGTIGTLNNDTSTTSGCFRLWRGRFDWCTRRS